MDAQRGQYLLADFLHREVGQFQLHNPFFELGGVQDVVEQAQHGSRCLVHGAQVATLLGVQGGVEQRLSEADDGVHGRADFVAHVGQEGAARGGGLLGALLGGAQLLLHGAALG